MLHLGDPIYKRILGFKIFNSQTRDIFNAFSGVEIQNKKFWKILNEHSKRRNSVVHQGIEVSEGEAQ